MKYSIIKIAELISKKNNVKVYELKVKGYMRE